VRTVTPSASAAAAYLPRRGELSRSCGWQSCRRKSVGETTAARHCAASQRINAAVPLTAFLHHRRRSVLDAAGDARNMSFCTAARLCRAPRRGALLSVAGGDARYRGTSARRALLRTRSPFFSVPGERTVGPDDSAAICAAVSPNGIKQWNSWTRHAAHCTSVYLHLLQRTLSKTLYRGAIRANNMGWRVMRAWFGTERTDSMFNHIGYQQDEPSALSVSSRVRWSIFKSGISAVNKRGGLASVRRCCVRTPRFARRCAPAFRLRRNTALSTAHLFLRHARGTQRAAW